MSDAEEHVRIDFAIAGHDDLEAAQKAERRAVERATRELRQENARLWECIHWIREYLAERARLGFVAPETQRLALETIQHLNRYAPDSEYQRRLAEVKGHGQP